METNGTAHSFGYPPRPAIAVRLHDTRLHTGLALDPGLYAAEAYMAGTLTFKDGSGVHDLLLLGNNQRRLAAVPSQQALRLHYHALHHWRTRFAGRRDKTSALTDERFVHTWEFNLSALGMDFLHGSHMVSRCCCRLSGTRRPSCGTTWCAGRAPPERARIANPSPPESRHGLGGINDAARSALAAAD